MAPLYFLMIAAMLPLNPLKLFLSHLSAGCRSWVSPPKAVHCSSGVNSGFMFPPSLEAAREGTLVVVMADGLSFVSWGSTTERCRAAVNQCDQPKMGQLCYGPKLGGPHLVMSRSEGWDAGETVWPLLLRVAVVCWICV